MRIKIGDIIKVYPSNALVQVIDIEKSFMRLAWLKNYWKTKHNIKLPKFFDILNVKFASHDKIYEYPRYKKCIKRLLRQKKAKKRFELEKKAKDVLSLWKKIWNGIHRGGSISW